MNTEEALKQIFERFEPNILIDFFRAIEVRTLTPVIRSYEIEVDPSHFCTPDLLGVIKLGNEDELAVFTIKVVRSLTERSGKKAQYELAKKILKTENRYHAGIFIFHDDKNDFRFSLVYNIPLATGKRDWSNFRRYTYFVGKKQTNKTFIHQITQADFSSVEMLTEAFSVEKVTKAFYSELQNWYFWGLRKVRFPEDAEKEPGGRNIALIRFITRIIFVWFMREKKLIQNKLFEKNEIKNILISLENGESTYYKAILQNLFFATLNTPIKERKFRRDKEFQGKNKDYMNHSYFRYHSLFKNPDVMLELFQDIPFLNGGLFECLDKRKDDPANYSGREIRIDGFSDQSKNQPVFPNELLFSEDINVDLSSDYGEVKYKKSCVHGIINILESYNFTTDENTPIDEEVALDPELLGKIFENLLASYNPVTASTARKATGSYYTPREIVSYMVSESLKGYFRTHLADAEKLDNKLDDLFSTDKEGNPFSTQETRKLVELIDDLRIADPAVGSGAFPMGVLNQLVFILSKLDHENELWKEAQLNALEKSIKDPVLKGKLKEQTIKQFAEKNSDYGRKLYLIQKCIYGVDIQQIAVEIAKLRFFISLLIDEEIDREKENWGIEPLPNLDFKIMQGNSLISEFMGLDLDANKQKTKSELFKDEIEKLIEEFENKKKDYQNESDKRRRSVLIGEINELIIKIFEAKLREQREIYFKNIEDIKEKYSILPNEKQRKELIEKEKQNLYQKEGFDLEVAEKQLMEFTEGQKAKPFFAWKLYFAEVFQEKVGFDIVIGNPPYVSTKGISENDKKNLEKQFGFADDLYNHFYFKGVDLLNEKGILTFISSKTFWTIQTKRNLRNLILKNKLLQLFDTANPFDASMVDTCVILIQKCSNPPENYIFKYLYSTKSIKEPEVKNGNIEYYKNAPNQVFFSINDYNIKVYERYGKKVNELLNKWWDKISTSKNIEKYKNELEKYRNSLKPGDITLLGLITEGGQGLATANNGKYIGVLEGTKWAENVKKQRPEKLLLAARFCSENQINNKSDAIRFLDTLDETDIRKLFDELKKNYGRDVFGQGWLYRIVSPTEIADVNSLTDDEMLNGIEGERTFVPYDKGDKDGNRWYAPTPYYINWNRENVKFLKENSGKKGEGMPVVRNPQFYFREGFCWTDVNSLYLKSRIKQKGVYDVLTMSLFTTIHIPDWYYVCLINSKFISKLVYDFINSTSHFQINDARQLPIIIPSNEQLNTFENIFNRAVEIQKNKFSGKIAEDEAEKQLELIQKELDKEVYELYDV
ncbi:MAG TPA: Eco57I restriction-modification methylase domain-containing protein [Victivallales bacterium]|nr:Eco57I restriction-modification methylase domain-containing protein [Victivallales bacterium]